MSAVFFDMVRSNYNPVVYYSRAIARELSKISIFLYSICIWCPV